MRQEVTATNITNDEGVPTGGTVRGVGILIDWQNGVLGRDGDRVAPNGAFVEGVIEAAAQRLEFFQASRFKCTENEEAIVCLRRALDVLDSRTARRESAGTEGTHQGS